MYVTVNDGHLTMKSEVFINIKNSNGNGTKDSSFNKSPRPGYYPPYLLPNHPIVQQQQPQPDIVSPPKIISTLEHVIPTKQKTEKNFITTVKQGTSKKRKKTIQ